MRWKMMTNKQKYEQIGATGLCEKHQGENWIFLNWYWITFVIMWFLFFLNEILYMTDITHIQYFMHQVTKYFHMWKEILSPCHDFVIRHDCQIVCQRCVMVVYIVLWVEGVVRGWACIQYNCGDGSSLMSQTQFCFPKFYLAYYRTTSLLKRFTSVTFESEY